MVGNTPDLTDVTVVTTGGSDKKVPSRELYIPLQFFWNRNPGLALPLIALQYHEVKINLELEDLSNLFWSGQRASSSADWVNASLGSNLVFGSAAAASLFIDYVYLEQQGRKVSRHVQCANRAWKTRLVVRTSKLPQMLVVQYQRLCCNTIKLLESPYNPCYQVGVCKHPMAKRNNLGMVTIQGIG